MRRSILRLATPNGGSSAYRRWIGIFTRGKTGWRSAGFARCTRRAEMPRPSRGAPRGGMDNRPSRARGGWIPSRRSGWGWPVSGGQSSDGARFFRALYGDGGASLAGARDGDGEVYRREVSRPGWDSFPPRRRPARLSPRSRRWMKTSASRVSAACFSFTRERTDSKRWRSMRCGIWLRPWW